MSSLPLLPRALGRATALVLLASLRFAHAAPGVDWAPNFTFAGIWHDNITNAVDSSDQLDSLQLNLDTLATNRYVVGPEDAVYFTGHLAGDWWPRYQELLGGALGARAEWRHTFGSGALAPVLSLEAGGDGVVVREYGRTGTSSSVTIALRKRLNDRWRAALTHEFGRFDARHAVYDRSSSETAAELGFDVNALTRFTLGGRYRDGDVVSYAATPSAGLIAITRVSESVDTFDRPQVASSFDARTWTVRAAFTRALDASSAIVLAYELRRTRAQPVEFTNQLISVAAVYQF